ncbi:Amidinotransferase family protein [Histomonas meleagridis]|uniref:Amidinotransferase family protein n=1 Tax=Histomonas meleagridis TaxID=135588 RepID=UPI00355A4D65|nr:Amidinotransferase family protein [Histomonas meleagridis]KAH0804700.1 Amidinotransferase family protein [Histomonas meleagridis]
MLSSLRKFRCFSETPLVKKVSSLVQVSEFDRPTDIITHCPSIETGFPFHLDAFLYEHPPDLNKATQCHDNFRKLMNQICGAKVWTVREILSQVPLSKLRQFLVDFSTINFRISPGSQPQELKHKEQRSYIEYSLSNLSANDLIDLILLHPSITIDVDKPTGHFTYQNIPLSPLANLTFTRDQQITTAKGVVIGRFGAFQRAPENDLMAYVWPQIGVNPVGRISNPGRLEGGDFIILGKHTSMMGIGLRSNMEAANQLMREDLLGTDRFIVVEDKVDCDQQRMHLDTFFNVLDDKLCVCVDAIADDDPKYIRIAHEFVKTENGYIEKKTAPFGKWLKDEKFTVVKATFKQQEDYFINLLHLGRDKYGKNLVLAINKDVEKAVNEVGFNGKVTYLDFSPITSMYGGVHCASQVLRQHQK